MRLLPTHAPNPATDEQRAQLRHLLASPRYNANHRAYYAPRLASLSWAEATQLIHKLTARYNALPGLLDYLPLGTCPAGVQNSQAYAALVSLTRTSPRDSGGRYRRTQPGEGYHLSYYTN